MHLEILVEDQSGKTALEILVPKIIGNEHTFTIHGYKGIGRIPKGLKPQSPADKRILLDQLPRLLRGYGKTFAGRSSVSPASLVIVCDLDQKCLKEFRRNLYEVLKSCEPKPETRFCIAIEEGEAWFLGDKQAIKSAYPDAKDTVLDRYVNDSICGTWELLADATLSGGKDALLKKGWQSIGKAKRRWAEKISPGMNVNCNVSPSFVYFCSKIRQLINIAT